MVPESTQAVADVQFFGLHGAWALIALAFVAAVLVLHWLWQQHSALKGIVFAHKEEETRLRHLLELELGELKTKSASAITSHQTIDRHIGELGRKFDAMTESMGDINKQLGELIGRMGTLS